MWYIHMNMTCHVFPCLCSFISLASYNLLFRGESVASNPFYEQSANVGLCIRVCVCVCDTLKRYRATLSSNVVHMLASNWNDMILIGWSYISSILSLERYHLFGCVCEASVTINHIFDVEYVPYEYYIWQWQKFPIFPLIKWRQKCHH